MTLKTFAATALLLLAAATAVAAPEPGTWDQIKDFSHEQKQAAVAEGRKLLKETDRQIAALKKEISRSTGEAKAAHQKNMAELQAKRKEAQAGLNQLQKSGRTAWDATKEGFGKAYQDLHQAWRKAADAATK